MSIGARSEPANRSRSRTPIGWEDFEAAPRPTRPPVAPVVWHGAGLVPSLPLYLGVGLVAGAVIALQICIMRVFAVGSWAHFGSLVVSLAMLAFGLVSAVMCVFKDFFARRWQSVAGLSLVLFAPLLIGANLAAQQVPFNAIFLVSDPNQKWRLAANFALYLLPFLAGALFLGTVFLKADRFFARVYFADLVGAGLGGLVFLGTLFLLPPENLVVTPVLLGVAGGAAWFLATAGRRVVRDILVLVAVGAAALAGHVVVPRTFGLTTLAVSQYKGIFLARNFNDSRLVYHNYSPFGDLSVYGSSYLHFAPGLSDNAAFNLPEIPPNAYLGLYIDGDGPSGVIRKLKDDETAYFRYLPMDYPYEIVKDPKTFVIQFGGGISTSVALREGSKSVTVAEANPAVLSAFQHDDALRAFTGDILADPRVQVVDYDGRLYLAGHPDSYDVVDLSLADSAGLSSPGGFAIVEKYAYTRQAMETYIRALKPGGVLSVTLWNKEEPPKSVLKLYATMVEAARAADPDAATRGAPAAVENDFFAVSTYLSTATVLYKKGGLTPADIAKLRQHTKALSFEEIYYPGIAFDASATDKLLSDYRNAIFSDARSSAKPAGADAGQTDPTGTDSTTDDPTGPDDTGSGPAPKVLPATLMGRLAWHALVYGGWDDIANRYVFDARPLTNDRPYFAAYVKPRDLPKLLDRLEIVQDEWGYLLLWATLGIAAVAAVVLVVLPVAFGWRAAFAHAPGKGRTILYFACLGLGYITVEVGLIADYTLALNNATVSASILITSMLMFSGFGSLTADRLLPRAREVLPMILLAIGALLIGYGLFLDRALELIGTLPYAWRLAICFLTVAPPAYLMGFPMPTAMTTLARLGKEHMFLWAWGINGCFSVLGAAAVPLIATGFGLSSVLAVGGVAYLVAIPAFFAVLLPMRARSRAIA